MTPAELCRMAAKRVWDRSRRVAWAAMLWPDGCSWEPVQDRWVWTSAHNCALAFFPKIDAYPNRDVEARVLALLLCAEMLEDEAYGPDRAAGSTSRMPRAVARRAYPSRRSDMDTTRLRAHISECTGMAFGVREALLQLADLLDEHQKEHEDTALRLSILSDYIIPERYKPLDTPASKCEGERLLAMAPKEPPGAKLHDLKCWPIYFEPLRDGRMAFQVRRNDRDFRVGDALLLREWVLKTETYTGRVEVRRVTYIFESECMKDGYVVLGISDRPPVHTEAKS